MVTVTKREAVKALVRGAMRAYRDDDMVCALTLAGAAEEALPRANELTAFDVFKVVSQWTQGLTDKQAADKLNAARNWLKHHSLAEPDEMDVDMAAVMLFRAISRYHAVYGLDDLTADFADFMGWSPARDKVSASQS